MDDLEAEQAVDAPDGSPERQRGRKRSKSNTPVKKKRARGELSSAEKKEQQGQKTWQDSWLNLDQFKGWLAPVKDDPFHAQCLPCNAKFSAGKSDAEKHARGSKHIGLVEGIKNVRPINLVFGAPTKQQKLDTEVKKAEISLAAFFTEHNIAIMIADHLVQLVKKIFHDSEIAKKLTLDRTKCTAVVKNVLAKTEKEEIVQDLKTVPFSVLVDESTDVGNIKNMCVLTKYVSPNTGRVCTPLLEMIELDAKDCSAENMYGKFKNVLCEQYEVPITNCIGMGTDHASVMIGQHNSFYSRLKADSPALVLMDCICHSSHLAAAAACKRLPAFVTTNIRRAVSYVSGSPKRTAILEEFQEFYSQEQRKLVSISQTRWLVMHSCVVRLLQNLTALEHFFLLCSQEDPKDKDAGVLCQEMRNPYFKAYLLFLKYALEYFNRMNALFQSAKVLVHKLQSESRQLLVQMCQNYMRPNVLESAHKIDDELAREWRNMPHEIPPDMVQRLKSLEPEDFWLEISTMKNYREVQKFPNLVKVARLCMSLPHSNAAAEGVFAVVTDTKCKKRNRMGNDTLDSICVVRTGMRQKQIACYQYEVKESHLKKHNKSMYDKQ
ncbi:hypothetical protein FOCC_FOCC007332 [Frankliniella occidentalis]|nr:hypothetical protein FOCC_FOCC007332 [Frankliniella occidentalis]